MTAHHMPNAAGLYRSRMKPPATKFWLKGILAPVIPNDLIDGYLIGVEDVMPIHFNGGTTRNVKPDRRPPVFLCADKRLRTLAGKYYTLPLKGGSHEVRNPSTPNILSGTLRVETFEGATGERGETSSCTEEIFSRKPLQDVLVEVAVDALSWRQRLMDGTW